MKTIPGITFEGYHNYEQCIVLDEIRLVERRGSQIVIEYKNDHIFDYDYDDDQVAKSMYKIILREGLGIEYTEAEINANKIMDEKETPLNTK